MSMSRLSRILYGLTKIPPVFRYQLLHRKTASPTISDMSLSSNVAWKHAHRDQLTFYSEQTAITELLLLAVGLLQMMNLGGFPSYT